MSSFDVIILVREVRFNCRRIKRVYAWSQAISHTWWKCFCLPYIDQSALWCVIVMMMKNMLERWMSIRRSTRFMINWWYQLRVLRGLWSNAWDITSIVITSIHWCIYWIRSVELVFLYIEIRFIKSQLPNWFLILIVLLVFDS